MELHDDASLLHEGQTCWRAADAGRAKLLIDGAAYFATVGEAFSRAKRSIHLLGWSFDPRTRLRPGDPAEETLGRMLMRLAAARPALDVRLLVWRSALPISATQAFFPHRAKRWFAGTGVQFELDAQVPFGACHHQKLVVIDDALAFVGGADFALDRYDSDAHSDVDPLRRRANGQPARPRHEVMAMVDGPAAAMLGALFRRRWARAVGAEAADEPAASRDAADLWPHGAAPDVDGGQFAVARTLPAWRGQPAIREIAALTLAAVAEARSLIYLENQYFTWPLMVEALARRLAEPAGPEVVLVCTQQSPSYFDQLTMDRARTNALWRLDVSDIFGRFHAYAPYSPGGRTIIAHAKLMVVDDRLVRIGSANLNNRSHGFDTECELAIEARADAERAAISALRDRLAAHWVGRPAQDLTELRDASGSLGHALWALDAGRRLRKLEARRLGRFGEFVADFHLGDPSDADDAWRPARRRRKLLDEVRALRTPASGPPPAADGPTPGA